MIVALDAFGPVTRPMPAHCEMAVCPRKSRKATDALDAPSGNNHQGGSPRAMRSAPPVSAPLVLFAAYNEDLKFFIANAAKFPYFRVCCPDSR